LKRNIEFKKNEFGFANPKSPEWYLEIVNSNIYKENDK